MEILMPKSTQSTITELVVQNLVRQEVRSSMQRFIYGNRGCITYHANCTIHSSPKPITARNSAIASLYDQMRDSSYTTAVMPTDDAAVSAGVAHEAINQHSLMLWPGPFTPLLSRCKIQSTRQPWSPLMLPAHATVPEHVTTTAACNSSMLHLLMLATGQMRDSIYTTAVVPTDDAVKHGFKPAATNNPGAGASQADDDPELFR
jgi:hypothetical protein